MMAKFPIVVSCAGCKVRRAFRTVEDVAAWARGHCCWEVRSDG